MTKITIIEGSSNDKDNVRVIVVKGEKGYSAYELYVKNGGTLTEAQWLDEFLNADNFYNKSEVDAKNDSQDQELLDEATERGNADSDLQDQITINTNDITGIKAEQTTQNNLIAKKPYYFNTVADMKAYNLAAGDMVITKGYYSANDGGEAEYNIVNDNTLVNDGGSVHSLNNGLKAVLINNNKANVKQFGAYGNNTNDDTNAIQNAIEFAYSNNLNIYLPSGIYKITSPLKLYENQRLYGENANKVEIHKTTNNTTTIDGTAYDAIIILTNYNNPNENSNNQKIDNIRLRGNIEGYISGKSILQYAIIGTHATPKLQISNFLISEVDVGIETTTMYTGWIKNSVWLQGWYSGIRITQGFQYTNIQNINIGYAHDKGIFVSGGAGSTISNVVSEFNEGNTCFHFEYCSLSVINCGAELGNGFKKGIYAFNSRINFSGCYFDGNRDDADAVMVEGSFSTIEINDTIFGYENSSTDYSGYFAYVRNNSQLILGHGIKVPRPFLGGVRTNNAKNSLTIDGSTINLYGKIISVAGNGTYYDTEYTQNLGKNILSEDYQRNNIFTGFINNPMKTKNNSNIEYEPSFNKGDIGIFNNPNVNGKIMWYCNRSNSSDYEPQTVGTISAVASNKLTFTDLTLEDYASTGIRLYNTCTITGVTSGATALVAWVDYVNNELNFSETITGFQVGEKVKLTKTQYVRQGDYLYIPFIHSGPSVNRPTANLINGQMYFDITLGKPIWYRVSVNAWVDASGNQV